MFYYNKIGINILSFIFSIIIFLLINQFIFSSEYFIQIKENPEIIKNQIEEKVSNIKEKINNKENNNNQSVYEEKYSEIEANPNIEYNLGIAIPKIKLNAQVENGTTKEIMNQYVGHFVDTSMINGNVCLGAHNRGYPVNYFQNIKSLKKGDYIFYKKDDVTRKYSVEIITVIKDTDWTYLENTEDNRITLITCVENEPEYRRCIQGIEIKN